MQLQNLNFLNLQLFYISLTIIEPNLTFQSNTVVFIIPHFLWTPPPPNLINHCQLQAIDLINGSSFICLFIFIVNFLLNSQHQDQTNCWSRRGVSKMTGSKGPPLSVCLWWGVHFRWKIMLNTHAIKAYKAHDISWLPFMSFGLFK